MTAHPTRVTFPGSVRFTNPPPTDAKGRPLRAVRNYDEKGNLSGTTVTVPAGKRAKYEAKEIGHASGKPAQTYEVSLEDDAPLEVMHAELEHETKPAAFLLKKATETKEAVTHETFVPTGVVIAKSVKHEGIAATGSSADEALAGLKLAVAEHEATLKAAADAAAAAEAAAAEAKTAADVAKELHPGEAIPKGDELVERRG